ncbi:histidine kinase [Arthrobacter sp. SPG23]|uniref:sensor histidine kinase n=1 Tax=Arthrobacter sp. SPG23 TaxID=1610703 RepID=UPI0005B92448|nr:HAMP domain-containing sensor histidine kinase [Arthrobacter sp. SPG23]KIS28041.1 histidine kinase [Arthrobacter sp. SPG23]
MQTAELLAIVAWALLWAVVIGAGSLLLLRPLRRTSLAVQICVVVLSTVAVLTAGMVSAFNAMVISARDLEVMWYVLAIASAVALAISLVLGARVSRNARLLAAAARSIGRGENPGLPAPLMSSELSELADELERSSRMLAESREREAAVENSRRELVSWISHDLRTPLASMRAMAEALEDGMAADVNGYYRKIISQTDQMAVMVNDLLELSKIQAGTLRLTAEPLDLYDLASDAIADLAPLAARRQITLDGGGVRECLALADGPSLGRAVRNVVLNAILYSKPGSGVTVEVGREGQDSVISVTDGCGGIAPEDIRHLFDTGWQKKNPARGRSGGMGVSGAEPEAPGYSGAGIGLSMVAGIVRAHDGSVTVENVDGGCRFSLRLPAEDPEHLAEAPRPRGPASHNDPEAKVPRGH